MVIILQTSVRRITILTYRVIPGDTTSDPHDKFLRKAACIFCILISLRRKHRRRALWRQAISMASYGLSKGTSDAEAEAPESSTFLSPGPSRHHSDDNFQTSPRSRSPLSCPRLLRFGELVVEITRIITSASIPKILSKFRKSHTC